MGLVRDQQNLWRLGTSYSSKDVCGDPKIEDRGSKSSWLPQAMILNPWYLQPQNLKDEQYIVPWS